MKRAAIGCALALGLVFGSAAAAQAGEYNGKGEVIPGAQQAHSLCAFSGKDIPDAIEGVGPEGMGDDYLNGMGNTANYGAFVRAGLKALTPSPGFLCNPTKFSE